MMVRGFLFIAIFVSVVASSCLSYGAILWEDAGPAKKQSRFNYDQSHQARDIANFWSKRKMAVGVATLGAYGLLGGTVSIHFHPQWSVDLGFGGGSHFQSLGFRVKKMLLLSSPLNPYIGLGFHRWQRSSSRPFNSADVSPGLVAKDFMSDTDRRSNRINERLLHASLGLQYTFTSGDWQGYGIFLEALWLVSVDDLTSAPTASLGFNYFF